MRRDITGWIAVFILAVATTAGLTKRIVDGQRDGCEANNVLRESQAALLRQAVIARTKDGDYKVAAGYALLRQRVVRSVAEFAEEPGSPRADCDQLYPWP